MAARFRLLIHPPADGAWNMAVDEALVRACAAAGPRAVPVLRLYGWSPPALSLGRGQDAATSHDPVYLRREGIDLVRRPTGGRAVLHEHERTYAVVARGGGVFGDDVDSTYAVIAAVLREAYAALGVAVETSAGQPESRAERAREPLCFARPAAHELVAGGRKLAGSAQRRHRGAFLQHGSLLLRADPERLGRAAGSRADPGTIGGLVDAAGARADAAEVDAAVTAAFARRLGTRPARSRLTRAERLEATRLRAWKYLSASWTLDGVERADTRVA